MNISLVFQTTPSPMHSRSLPRKNKSVKSPRRNRSPQKVAPNTADANFFSPPRRLPTNRSPATMHSPTQLFQPPLEEMYMSQPCWVISSGFITSNGRSMSYYIREIYHICVTVNVVVATTQQTWTVFVALSEPISELLRILAIKSKEDKLYAVAQLILSCISLNFRENMIVAAHVDSPVLQRGCRVMLMREVSSAAIQIQSIVRMHQVQMYCQTFTAKQQKIRNAVKTAKRRVNKFYRERSLMESSLAENSLATFMSQEQSLTRRSRSPVTRRYLASKTPQPPVRERPSHSGARTSPRPQKSRTLVKAPEQEPPTSPEHQMPEEIKGEIRELRQQMLSVVSHVESSVTSLMQQQFAESMGDSMTLSQEFISYPSNDTEDVVPVIASSLENDDVSYSPSASFAGNRLLMRKSSVAQDNEAEVLRFELTKMKMQLSVLQGQLDYQRKLNSSTTSIEKMSHIAAIPTQLTMQSVEEIARLRDEEEVAIRTVKHESVLKRFKNICLYYLHRRKMTLADVLRLRTLLKMEEFPDMKVIIDGMKFAKNFGHVELASKLSSGLSIYLANCKKLSKDDFALIEQHLDFFVVFMSDFLSIEFIQRKSVAVVLCLMRMHTKTDLIDIMGSAGAGEAVIAAMHRHINVKEFCVDGLKCLIKLCHKYEKNRVRISNEKMCQLFVLLYDTYPTVDEIAIRSYKLIAIVSMRRPHFQDQMTNCGVTAKMLNNMLVDNIANHEVVHVAVTSLLNLSGSNEQNAMLLSSRTSCKLYRKALEHTANNSAAFVPLMMFVLHLCSRTIEIKTNFLMVDITPLLRRIVKNPASDPSILKPVLMVIHKLAEHDGLKARFMADGFEDLVRRVEASPATEQIRRHASDILSLMRSSPVSNVLKPADTRDRANSTASRLTNDEAANAVTSPPQTTTPDRLRKDRSQPAAGGDRMDEIRAKLAKLEKHPDFLTICALRPSAMSNSISRLSRFLLRNPNSSKSDMEYMLLCVRCEIIKAQINSLRRMRQWARRTVGQIRHRKWKKEAAVISRDIAKCTSISDLRHALDIAVKIGDCDLCSDALHRLAALVSGIQGKMYLPDLKTHSQLLIQVMREFLSIMIIQRNVVDIFGFVLSSSPNAQWIDAQIQYGLCDTIVAGLKRHMKNGELFYNHIKFFNKFIGMCKEMKDSIVSVTTCTILVHALQQYIDAPIIVEKITRSISLLCFLDGQDIFYDLNVAPLLVRSLRNHHNKLETLLVLSRCMSNLMALNHSGNQLEFGKSEHCDVYAEALMQHIHDVTGFKAISLIISAVFTNNSTMKRVFITTSLPDVILRILTDSTAPPAVLKATLSLLYSWLTDQEAQQHFQTMGLDGVFSRLESHPAEEVRIDVALCVRRVLLSRGNMGTAPTTRERSVHSRHGDRGHAAKQRETNDAKTWDFAKVDFEMPSIHTPIKPTSAIPDSRQTSESPPQTPQNPTRPTIVKIRSDRQDMEGAIKEITDEERTKITKRDALLRLKRVVKSHIDKERERKAHASKMFRLQALLQTINTSTNIPIVIEAMKMSIECGNAKLAEESSSRLVALLSEEGAFLSNNVTDVLSRECRAIFNLMSSFQSNADIQLSCANVILLVLGKKDAILDEALSEQGLCDAIFACMDRHYSKNDICNELLKCLVRLVSFHSPSRVRASSTFGCQVIAKLFNYYPVATSISERLCRCIYVLALKTPDVQLRFVHAGVMDRIVLFIRQCVNDPKGFTRMSKTIMAFCSNTNENHINIILNEGTRKSLIETMFACVRGKCLRGMVLLFVAMSNCDKLFAKEIVEGGFFDILTGVLRDRSVDDTSILMILAYVDHALSRVPYIKKSTMSELEKVLRALAKQDEQPKFKEKATQILLNNQKIKFYFEAEERKV